MKYKKIISECNPSQTHEELNDLLLELENIKIKNVLEIGVHRGGSLCVWNKVLKPKILIGVDGEILLEAELIGGTLIGGYSQHNEVYDQVKQRLKGELFDFIFIDGSHYYNDVKTDFLMYKELVRPGGVIAFHDINVMGNYTCDVNKFWTELTESGEYKTKTISYRDQLGEVATGTGIVYL